MAADRILRKGNLSYLLRQFRKKRSLIAPMREGSDIVFKTVDNIHEIALNCPALIPSPKEFLFPQYEAMFRLKRGRAADLADSSKRVIFGVRSCDVSAVRILDRFYLQNMRDPYYEVRRKNTVFISIVCNVPDNTCFCMSLGTGPYLSEGFDIQLYDLGDRYFVRTGSTEAERLIGQFSFLMEKPSKSDMEDMYEVELSSKAMFQKRINLEGARNQIESGLVTDDMWKGVTERCFECGGCVYECPLCTCFTVVDRKSGDVTERARIWDACLFKGFTWLAGGTFPMEDRILRTKRWFYHKLIHYPETLGAFGCVGCGRCTVTCPGRIDMASVVSRFKHGQK